jgi:glycosidase
LPLVDPARRNVADQSGDSASLLSLYRDLIGARRSSAALRRGTHRSFFGVAPEVLTWLREAGDDRVLTVLNVGDRARPCQLPLAELGSDHGTVVVATSDRAGAVGLADLVLEPLEGIAIRLG